MLSTRHVTIVFLLIIFALGTFGLAGCEQNREPQLGDQPKEESVFNRVLRTGKIRASYATYPPYAMKDPNTGNMTGVFVEVLENIGEKLGVRIEWVEEVGWGTIFEGLESGRHDMFGAGLWENSSRAKNGYFSKPLFYNAIRIWVRAEETRFKTLGDINSPNVRLTVQDGAMDDIISRIDFPKARKVSIPQLSPWSDNLLNMVSGKADVSMSEIGPIAEYLEKNPGTLKELKIGKPLRVFANSYALKAGEERFKSIIDATIDELTFDGTIERILQKYEKVPGQFLRVSLPYEMLQINDPQIKRVIRSDG